MLLGKYSVVSVIGNANKSAVVRFSANQELTQTLLEIHEITYSKILRHVTLINKFKRIIIAEAMRNKTDYRHPTSIYFKE